MINPYWRPNYLGLSIIRRCRPNLLYPSKRRGWYLGICMRCNKVKPRVCALLKMTLINRYNGNKLQKIYYPTHQFRICFECLRSKDLLPNATILKVNNQILSICVFNIFTEKILGSVMIKKVLQIQKKRIRELEKRIQTITLQFKEQKRFLKSANVITPNFFPSYSSLEKKKEKEKNKKEKEKENKKKEKEEEEKKRQKHPEEEIEEEMKSEIEEKVEGGDSESEGSNEDEKKNENNLERFPKAKRFKEPNNSKEKGLYKERNCRNKKNKKRFDFQKFLDLQKRNFKKNENKKQNPKQNPATGNDHKRKTTNKNSTNKYFSLKKIWIKQSNIQQQQIKSKSITNLMPSFVKKRKIKVFNPNNSITNNFQNQTEFKNKTHNFKNLKQHEKTNDFILKKHIFDNDLKSMGNTLQAQKKKICTNNNNNNKNKNNSTTNKYNKNNYNNNNNNNNNNNKNKNNNNNNKYTKNKNKNKNKNNEQFVQIKQLSKINTKNPNKLNFNFNSENQKEFHQKRALPILSNQKTNLKNKQTRTIKNNRYKKPHQQAYQNIHPKRTRFNSNVSHFQTKNSNSDNSPNTQKQTKGIWGTKTNQSIGLQRQRQIFPIKNSLFNQKVNYTFIDNDKNNWCRRIEVGTNDSESTKNHNSNHPNTEKIQEKFIDNVTIRNFTENHNNNNFSKRRKRKKKKRKKKIIGETLFL
ncbi:ribonuclease mrp protein subunit snm1 [Anaeramoeba flamelloides]|uniref:Ribonuclease mrp protein subunit snm1 n=1 Tax=Anaeramoeba flamelloides TaxID=1746091 RepID=A0ABQ8XE28_9EUKA|nr:ribonuclease mrp protein subunit snm1 [Anaeramoeba flamelloides]